MKFRYTILLTLALMLFVSCTKEDLVPDTTGKGLTLTVPIAIVGEQPIADAAFTRVPSDPGVDDKLTLPQNLYIWVCLQTASNVVAVSYRHYEITGSPYSWTNNNDIELSFALPKIEETSTLVSVGQIYAIASRRALSGGELNGIYNGFTATEYMSESGYCLKTGITSATFNLLDNAVFTPETPWMSDDLRDLYSTSTTNEIHVTHLNDDIPDDDIPAKADKVKTVDDAPVKLYHCAAKADFQWESTSDVTVNSITIKNLPTTCKIFKPTQNTNSNGLMKVTTDITSKWIGRKCVYVFQPYSPSTLTYDVYLKGKTDLTNQSSPSAVSGTNFTTWYRVRATITNPNP